MKTQLPTPTEHEIQNTIIELLQRQKYLVWRNNVGAQSFEYKGSKRWVRFSQPGHADIFAIQPKTGRFVAIECKRVGAKATSQQEEFLRSVNTQGGLGFVATSVSEVATALGIKL